MSLLLNKLSLQNGEQINQNRQILAKEKIQMYKNLASFIGTQNVFTLKNKMLCALTILIFAACFTTGCENVSTREVLDLFSTVDLNRTITVTLDEKNGSGITGEATFGEYSIESGVILSFDVKIQNAGPWPQVRSIYLFWRQLRNTW